MCFPVFWLLSGISVLSGLYMHRNLRYGDINVDVNLPTYILCLVAPVTQSTSAE